MGFLGRVHGVTHCDKMCSCESCRTLNVEPQNAHEGLATPTVKRPRDHPSTRGSDCISDLAWSRRSAEPAELSEIAFYREGILGPPRALPPGNL